MRGLLIKDVRFTLKNKRMVMILLLVAALLLVTQGKENATFIIGYMTMVCGMLVLSTISADEFDKSGTFLMTLPIDRSTYAKEKYIFAFGSSLAGWVLATIPCMLMQIHAGKEVLLQAAAIFAVISVFQLVMLPIQLKFGGENGRMVLLGMFAFLAILIFLIDKIGKIVFANEAESEHFFLQVVNRLSSLNGWSIGITVCILWALCFAISLSISQKIMRKKEF